MALVRRAGTRRHRVALQALSARTAAGDGYTETWATYGYAWASVQPATAADVERRVGGTTTTPITHLVETDYRADLTAAHRLLLDTRPLYIRGLQNIDERNKTWMLACEERRS